MKILLILVGVIPLYGQLNSQWTALNRIGDLSNSETVCYLPSQVTVSGGNLVITAANQTNTCHDTNINGTTRNGPSSEPYASGMIQSASFSFTYGTVEFRVKMPAAAGAHPGSLWLLGGSAGGNTGCQISNPHSADNIGTCAWSSNAQDSSEIDICEDDNDTSTLRQNKYNEDSGAAFSNTVSVSNTSSNWHICTLVWTPGSLIWKIDGIQTSSTTTGVPSNPMFPIINLAIGGVGTPNPAQYPDSLLVDYVSIKDQGGTVIFFDDFLNGGGSTRGGSVITGGASK